MSKKWKKRARQAEKALKKAYEATHGSVLMNPRFGPRNSKEYGIFLMEYHRGSQELLKSANQRLDILGQRNMRLEDFVDLAIAREKSFPHAWTEECDSPDVKVGKCPKCVTGDAYDEELKQLWESYKT